MHCCDPNLFWHGCSEFKFFGPQIVDYPTVEPIKTQVFGVNQYTKGNNAASLLILIDNASPQNGKNQTTYIQSYSLGKTLEVMFIWIS